MRGSVIIKGGRWMSKSNSIRTQAPAAGVRSGARATAPTRGRAGSRRVALEAPSETSTSDPPSRRLPT
jgi:hypothetical protein